MAYPTSWTCPSCGATIFNSIKCTTCSYQPPSESGELNIQPIKETMLKERIIAFLIDIGFIILIASLTSVAAAFSLTQQFDKPIETMIPLFIIPINIIFLILHPIYFIILEGKYSASYGKKIMKIEVLCDKGFIGFYKSLIRNLTRFIEALALYIPSIIKIKKEGKRWGDIVAGTYVTKEKV